MMCEHKTLRPLKENPNIYFCLDCGARFEGKTLSPISIEESKPKEVATIQIFLTEQEYKWLVKELNKKIKGCSFMLEKRADYLNRERIEKIKNSKEIAEMLLSKLKTK